ncbi:MAG TPA: cell envelope integrity protein CreD [Polyangiaceae bacterium]|nr:cell envelope integrity protein CreD [Polyangiaceae bacterium]
MNVRLLFKVVAIFLISLLLLIPIALIDNLVGERQQLRDAVVQDIGRSAGAAQAIIGPLLVVPYTRTVRSVSEEVEGQPRRTIEKQVSGELVFLPSDFELSASLGVNELSRGIYRARVFDAQSRITGGFAVPQNYGITSELDDYRFGAPLLALGVSDPRGIGHGLSLRWGGADVAFQPGASTALLQSGVHAALPASDPARPWHTEFAIALSLQGTGDFQVTPVGAESRVHVSSNWPHPSFVGDFLPREREVTAQGFDARWQTSFFATNLESIAQACAGAGPGTPACAELSTRRFGVTLIDPVDHYLMSERATKYAFLFIGLTFAAFFLFEVLRRTSVHPVQYGLVGLSLAVFFLLLLSLSEHLGFAPAYSISAAASTLLIAYYVAHVLGDGKQGALLGGALGALYAMLYVILGSEDYALLIGSLLVFAVLAAIMVLTRKVSWSRFGQLPAADGS